ncbi:MAG: choice-of-anchor D domain-containing protein [Acidobacteria bacterium]|nr:choice-of-anchor D domain-containing protein [Acidobacteriota bacterium]
MKNKLIWLALLLGLGLMPIQSPLSHGVWTAAPMCSIRPGLLYVGEACVGKTIDDFFVVQNQGDQPFTINAINSSNPAFSIVSPLPMAVPAGGEVMVEVRLNCTELGDSITTLDFDATSASGPVQCESILAVGTCRRPICSKERPRLDFGSVAVGQSVKRSFLVGPDLFLSRRLIPGSSAVGFTINAVDSSHAAFSVVSALPMTVTTSSVIMVRFTCTEAGPQRGTLTFDADSFDKVCGKVDCHIDVLGQCVGAIFTVTNTNDDGSGSLRQAILDANRNPGLDGIQVEPVVNATISPGRELPPITDPVIIDGAFITLNGERAGSGANGLVLERGASTVQRLKFTGLDGDGLVVEEGAGGSTIKGIPARTTKMA